MFRTFFSRSLASLVFISLSVIVAVFFVVTGAKALTTISTDINTGGALTVTGVITAGSNITIPASYSLDTAATGILNIGTSTATTINIGSVSGTTVIRGFLKVPAGYSLDTLTAGILNIGTTTATTINIGSVSGATAIRGFLTVPAGYSFDTATAGTLNIGTTTANAITIGKAAVTTSIFGTASTSAVQVGGGTLISNMVFGFCTIADTVTVASTTVYANCTGATGVSSTLGFRVFLQATSSLPGALQIHAASSTATVVTIGVLLLNTGLNGVAVTQTGIYSFNFWAVR